MKFLSWYFVHAHENVFEIHVLVSIMAVHIQMLVFNKNAKIIFFVIVKLRT